MFDLEEETFESIKRKFGRIKLTRSTNVKKLTVEGKTLSYAFKPLTIKDKSRNIIWSNSIPNSPFTIRPVLLLARSENQENRFSNEGIHKSPYNSVGKIWY